MTEIILAIIAIVGTPLGAWVSARLLKQKYAAEVEKLRAEAESVQAEVRSHQIDTDRKAIEMIMELVVEPLRRDMKALQRKVDRLTHAIEQIHKCPYSDDCPVAHELQRTEASDEREPERGRGDGGTPRGGGDAPGNRGDRRREPGGKPPA